MTAELEEANYSELTDTNSNNRNRTARAPEITKSSIKTGDTILLNSQNSNTSNDQSVNLPRIGHKTLTVFKDSNASKIVVMCIVRYCLQIKLLCF